MDFGRIWFFDGDHAYPGGTPSGPDRSAAADDHCLDVGPNRDTRNGALSDADLFFGGFVLLWADGVCGRTPEQLYDRGARQLAGEYCAFAHHCNLWHGHGAWPGDRRLDRRALWHAYEFLGLRHYISHFKCLYAFCRCTTY